MEKDYSRIIDDRARHVFDVMALRSSADDVNRIKASFEFAREAHATQKRKTGEPYILHPIAVARIAAEELMLDVSSVIAAFLHDVVEDTPHTIEEISSLFGDDVAFLVSVMTKEEKETYDESRQVDNFRRMLGSVQYDIRPLLIKLSDRLHNMRTLSSMRPDKQMKIAGETDYFYAPLANRLGLYNVKTELENLSFRFRCPHEYDELVRLIDRDTVAQHERLQVFCNEIRKTLQRAGTGGISNYIDSPKENGYQSFHVKLLADFGRWQEVHLSSERMVRDSQLGCMSDRSEDNIRCWIDKFRHTLRDIQSRGKTTGSSFIEQVVASFYNDDIMTFTPNGRPVVLPQRSTVLDFAYEVSAGLGQKAKYARVNGFLTPVKAPLRRGDVVEVFTDEGVNPRPDWLDAAITYKARKAITSYLDSLPKPPYVLADGCNPIPGDEVIGFRRSDGSVEIHKRECPTAIRLASQLGDNIVSVDFKATDTLYPVTISIRAVDRYHLLLDLVDSISNKLMLNMTGLTTDNQDNIITCRIQFSVHSADELQTVMHHIASISGVDEVKRLS